ncbi:unnamed protein product, partial [Amoebophrya sp. A25]|eukprot:GSA25T00015004001.1
MLYGKATGHCYEPTTIMQVYAWSMVGEKFAFPTEDAISFVIRMDLDWQEVWMSILEYTLYSGQFIAEVRTEIPMFLEEFLFGVRQENGNYHDETGNQLKKKDVLAAERQMVDRVQVGGAVMAVTGANQG